MTAFVIIFQLMGTFTAFFGPFATAVALIPIVIGASMCGVAVGSWLGLVFGIVVLASGNAAFFLTYEQVGTVVTVLLKGLACGAAAGLVYKLLHRLNDWVAVIGAAIVCPVVNTGVFLLGCLTFFMDDAAEIAAALGSDASGVAVFWALAMANFIFEVGMNVVVSPVMVKIISLRRKTAGI